MSVKKFIGVLTGLLVVATLSAQKPKSYNLKVGQEFTLNVLVESYSEQDIMGQKQVINQNVNNVDKYEVVSKDADGYRLKVTGLRRKVLMSGMAGDIDMDSAEEGEEHLAMRALTGKVYFMNISKYGKVMQIDDFAAYKEEIKTGFEGTSLAGQGDQVLASVTEENAQTTFESFFYIYSPTGEKNWQNEYTMTLNALPVNISLDYSRPAANQVVANGKLELSGDIDLQGMTMQAELSGTQVTTFELDKKTGLSNKVEISQTLSGDIKMQSITVPMTVETKSTATISW
ncbi:MAG: hypothetical protein Roseis2KO_36210 [Roseivirga sp.]